MTVEFSLNVNVGVTPELSSLLRALIGGTEEPRAPRTITIPEPVVEEPAEEPAPAERPKKKGKKAEKKEEPVAEEPAAEETPAAEEPKNELTEQDVRDAMHRTRRRIEGEDYTNKTKSEGYVKYHKVLTATFLEIATELGSDKPSTLPAEKRGEFIARCAELGVDGEGNITVNEMPF